MSDEVELKVRIPKDLFAQIEEHRYSGRFPSRKAAVVDLLLLALSSDPDGDAEQKNE